MCSSKGITESGVSLPYSDPIPAPFPATEQIISSITHISATMTTASTQNTSKYASANACCWSRFAPQERLHPQRAIVV
ncbi:MAG: hypothetical protein JO270_02315 [Acidobacteriaceae bacterium]|nr:hypothetical protein [Acidobacteriaceae bacterium]